jgi:hypothetical protein
MQINSLLYREGHFVSNLASIGRESPSPMAVDGVTWATPPALTSAKESHVTYINSACLPNWDNHFPSIFKMKFVQFTKALSYSIAASCTDSTTTLCFRVD